MVENKTDNIDSQINRPREGSGSLLASARKAQNKSVEEIAAELNLSITQIKTIELDQSEGLPEPTYVRGYIRSYARLLGLDAEKILESYLNPNWQKSSSLDEMPKGIANADEIKGRRFLTSSKIVTLLIILSIATFLWFSGLFSNLLSSFDGTDNRPNIQSNTPTTQTEKTLLGSTPVNTEGVEGVASSKNNLNINNAETNVAQAASVDTGNNSLNETTAGNSQSAEQGQISGSNVIDNNNAASTVNNSTADSKIVDEPQAGHNLILTFVETCWVDIRDNNDKRLAYKSYRVGDELVVSNDQVLNVFLGNAEGVKATYNGKPFDMSPYREGVYAKFSLGKN